MRTAGHGMRVFVTLVLIVVWCCCYEAVKVTTLDGHVVESPDHERPQREDDVRGHNRQHRRLPPTQRSTTSAKPTPQTPKPRPPLGGRNNIDWYEESHSFALKASVDSRLLIRHAPIPLAGSPWPMPQHYDPDKRQFMLDPHTFKFQSAGEMCDVLRYSFRRVRKNAFGEEAEHEDYANRKYAGSNLKEITHLNVTVLKECSEFPSLESDESYDLDVKSAGASIIAREVWGALRGLETFSQLVHQDKWGRFVINKTFVNDYPRFAHRGILLDTSRHFLRKEIIIQNLEAMSQNKMNVFHWHIVDDQSFPFESKTFPNMTKYGSYEPTSHIYTHEDMAEIIDEARLRGIRVVPEFDTPGHTYSWGYGMDHLLTPCYDYEVDGPMKPNGYFGPINPILKSSYSVVTKLFREVLHVFKDKYVHLGGDEVPFDCWQSNPHIMSFIRRNNLSDIKDVLSLYERKLLDIIAKLGKKRDKGSGYIVWQEIVDNGVKLKPDTIVQIWMGDTSDIERITNMGLRTIYSTCWYLDYISYGMDWDKYYKCEQIGQRLDDYNMKNESLLIGGEACFWAEYVSNENLISRFWPRAAAAAERLWSSKKVDDTVEAGPRIEEQRCRMLKRGLPVGVLSGPGHCRVTPKKMPTSAKSFTFFGKENAKSIQNPFQFARNVYIVDVNSMYLIPLLIIVGLCCLILLSTLHEPRSRIIAILMYPVSHMGQGSTRRNVRSLVAVFLMLIVIWCIWSAPLWMNTWEYKPQQRQQGYSDQSSY